jgi:hypothetical protein
MKTSSAYKTIASSYNKTSFQNMRPGEVLVKNGHALMFLYYANSAKTSCENCSHQVLCGGFFQKTMHTPGIVVKTILKDGGQYEAWILSMGTVWRTVPDH